MLVLALAQGVPVKAFSLKPLNHELMNSHAEVNVIGTRNVLEACKKQGDGIELQVTRGSAGLVSWPRGVKKLVFSSTPSSRFTCTDDVDGQTEAHTRRSESALLEPCSLAGRDARHSSGLLGGKEVRQSVHDADDGS